MRHGLDTITSIRPQLAHLCANCNKLKPKGGPRFTSYNPFVMSLKDYIAPPPLCFCYAVFGASCSALTTPFAASYFMIFHFLGFSQDCRLIDIPRRLQRHFGEVKHQVNMFWIHYVTWFAQSKINNECFVSIRRTLIIYSNCNLIYTILSIAIIIIFN